MQLDRQRALRGDVGVGEWRCRFLLLKGFPGECPSLDLGHGWMLRLGPARTK